MPDTYLFDVYRLVDIPGGCVAEKVKLSTVKSYNVTGATPEQMKSVLKRQFELDFPGDKILVEERVKEVV